MSTTEITDVLILTAVDRAVRHDHGGTSKAAPVWAVYEHLGVPRRSGAGRRLRARLTALDGSALERGKRHGAETWALTKTGKRRVSRLRAQGKLPYVPESPQHRLWREAQEQAGQRIEGFRLAVLDAVEHTQELLDAPVPGPPVLGVADAVPGPSSDAWFEAGERLRQACRRLASASYCLWEWAEPDDASADVDELRDPCDKAFDAKERAKRRARRRGRRNTRLWDSNPQLVFIGQAIREAREQHDISPDELACKARISERRLARIEAGKVDTDYLSLIRLARAMDAEAAALMGRACELEAEEGCEGCP